MSAPAASLACTTPLLLREAALRFGGRAAIVDHAAGVTLDHAGLLAASQQVAAALIAEGLCPGERVAIWAPNGWQWVAAALGLHAAGGVLVPLNTRYKGAEAGDILRLSGARFLFVSRPFLGNDYLATAYGLTECSGVATMCRQGDDPAIIAATSGRAIPDTELRIVDANGAALPPGEAGEVCVRGYHVMRGYHLDPAETARAIDADGWLRTGDVGVLDEAGNLRITDRLKDMYIVGGFNAYPAEIESALSLHEGVAQAAVIGVPDERLGEVGVAFVVPRPGATVDPAALIAWARERIANFKVPRHVIIVDELPRNASGKVEKWRLREAWAALRPDEQG